MPPAPHRTPPKLRAVGHDDLGDAPSSTVRALLPLFAIPSLAVTVAKLRDLPLDSRTAYLLSLVDGQCSIETIVDICEMNREEALDLLAKLLQLGAIELRDP